MRKFAVGDRVAVYGYFAPKGGGSVRRLDGDRGKVAKVDSVGGLEVRLDVPFGGDPYLEEPHLIDDVHPKQCRLLKKVPSRVIYVHRTCPSNAAFWAMFKSPSYTREPAAHIKHEYLKIVDRRQK